MIILWAIIQVILIDISLSGDNAVVIGMAAAGLQPWQRKTAIMFGTMCAITLRIIFSVLTVTLLQYSALTFIAGLLLLWVSWKMYQEIRESEQTGNDNVRAPKTLLAAIMQITIADVTMSLDNVLAVAGASQGHPMIMAFGLLLSISLMAVAANYIATWMNRWPVLKYVGLMLILYVAGSMITKALIATPNI